MFYAFLLNAVFAAGPAATPELPAKPTEVRKQGYPTPSLDGFDKIGSIKVDASLAIDGEETTVEKFQNKDGDQVVRLVLNDVVWAWGVLPKGDPMKGYILRDPACAKKLTEKWTPTAPFNAPECAVKA